MLYRIEKYDMIHRDWAKHATSQIYNDYVKYCEILIEKDDLQLEDLKESLDLVKYSILNLTETILKCIKEGQSIMPHNSLLEHKIEIKTALEYCIKNFNNIKEVW